MKQIFSRILILICFLIDFSKSKTLENITEDQAIDVKQISLINSNEIKSKKAEEATGNCAYGWIDAPYNLGITWVDKYSTLCSRLTRF